MKWLRLIIALSFCWTCIIFTPYLYAEISEETVADDFFEFSTEQDPIKRLGLLEGLLENASEYEQFVILPELAKTAIEINNFSKAENYANELLCLANDFQDDWNYGNAIHDANVVLGMVSLQKDLVEEAKDRLLKAGKAPSSPQLKSFGPNMMLAEALLDKGEKDVVIRYFELLKNVWEYHDGRLDSWIAAVRGGGKPYFGPNLYY